MLKNDLKLDNDGEVIVTAAMVEQELCNLERDYRIRKKRLRALLGVLKAEEEEATKEPKEEN